MDGWDFDRKAKLILNFRTDPLQEVNLVSGPFDSPNGQLFLWLSDKGEEGTMPLRLIKDQLVEEINQARINQAVTPLLQKHEGIVHESVIGKAFEPDTLAYSSAQRQEPLLRHSSAFFPSSATPATRSIV